jgi:alpha-D-xyloside xylohydrolase
MPEQKIDRRQLGKGIAAGIAASLLGEMPLHAAPAGTAISPAGAQQPSSSPQLDGQWMQVHPGVWKASFGKPEAVTPVSSRLVAPLPDALAKLPSAPQPPIAAPIAKHHARGVTLSLPLQPYEEVYGFGLQFFSLQHRAKKLITRVNADPKSDTGDTHAPVPFYITSKGYGILIDTVRYTTFYCGEARDKPTEAVNSAGNTVVPTTTNDLYAKKLADSQPATMLVDVPSCEGVDVYLFAGPTTLDAVRRYNLFSGGGINPPEWGLGFWYRTQSNATAADISKLMQEFRDRHIPCDVLGIEAGWQTHAYSCTFVWKPELFPDPSIFIQQMRSKDLHVNLWEHAFTNPASPIFTPLVPLSGDKGVWGGLVPDFQDPRARKVFGD